MNWVNKFKALGPGLLFAGAAIGVSHLVQSTRAGAGYGFTLLWAVLIIHLVKYPFYQFGPRYALATGESIIKGYQRLGKGLLLFFSILTLASMFSIQAAVTIVTVSLAANLMGFISESTNVWIIIITVTCLGILYVGRYKLLDSVMKFVVISLTICTVIAVTIALVNNQETYSLQQILPVDQVDIIFLIALMGWMPAPMDLSVWHSLWTLKKQETLDYKLEKKQAIFDFNIGYFGALFLAICFVTLGALVMFNSGETISSNGSEFSKQLINLYTENLGRSAYIFIAIAALATMFSTTITCLDASPRVMAEINTIFFKKTAVNKNYNIWLIILALGTLSILFFFVKEMGLMVKIATILSFVTAPFYAITNFILMRKYVKGKDKLSNTMIALSWFGIIFLIGFSIWYIYIIV